MAEAKALDVRQRELQALLVSPAGRAELDDLAARYAAASGRLRPTRTALITDILVHERELGLIDR
jgi:hypothetical protein